MYHKYQALHKFVDEYRKGLSPDEINVLLGLRSPKTIWPATLANKGCVVGDIVFGDCRLSLKGIWVSYLFKKDRMIRLKKFLKNRKLAYKYVLKS